MFHDSFEDREVRLPLPELDSRGEDLVENEGKEGINALHQHTKESVEMKCNLCRRK